MIDRDDFLSAMRKIQEMPPTPPMRWVMGFDEAKQYILAGQADRVLVSPKVLERLKADLELHDL